MKDTLKSKIPAPKEFIFLQVLFTGKQATEYLMISAVKSVHDPQKSLHLLCRSIKQTFYYSCGLNLALAFFFFSVNGQRVNILAIVSHMVYVATTQLCYYSMKEPQKTCKQMSMAVLQ